MGHPGKRWCAIVLLPGGGFGKSLGFWPTWYDAAMATIADDGGSHGIK